MDRGIIVAVVLLVLVALSTGTAAQTNDAWIPGIASFVVPGVGQLLNNQMDKAILHFGVMVAINVGTYYTASFFRYSYYRYSLIGLLHLGWAVYSGMDAYNVAKEQGFRLSLIENGIAFTARL